MESTRRLSDVCLRDSDSTCLSVFIDKWTQLTTVVFSSDGKKTQNFGFGFVRVPQDGIRNMFPWWSSVMD